MLQRIKTEALLGLAIAVSIIAIILIAATYELVPFGQVDAYDIIRVLAIGLLLIATMWLIAYSLLRKSNK